MWYFWLQQAERGPAQGATKYRAGDQTAVMLCDVAHHRIRREHKLVHRTFVVHIGFTQQVIPIMYPIMCIMCAHPDSDFFGIGIRLHTRSHHLLR